MILPNDLKIGNTVALQFPTRPIPEPCVVLELKAQSVTIKDPAGKAKAIVTTYKDLQPVALNKTILEKYGFKSDGKSRYRRDSIYLIEGKGYKLIDEAGKAISSTNITALHQLQNLFNDISGGYLSDQTGHVAKCTCTFNPDGSMHYSLTCPVPGHAPIASEGW